MYTRIATALAILLVSGGVSWSAENDDALLVYCSKLNRIEFYRFVDKLGQMKDFRSLSKIYNSQLPCGDYAAGVYCRSLDGKDAVSFCCGFPIGSALWVQAFCALEGHRKEAVLPYIRHISRSDKPEVRYLCYATCRVAGWEDLLALAMSDVEDQRPIAYPGTGGSTLGKGAKEYIEHFKKR